MVLGEEYGEWVGVCVVYYITSDLNLIASLLITIKLVNEQKLSCEIRFDLELEETADLMITTL